MKICLEWKALIIAYTMKIKSTTYPPVTDNVNDIYLHWRIETDLNKLGFISEPVKNLLTLNKNKNGKDFKTT